MCLQRLYITRTKSIRSFKKTYGRSPTDDLHDFEVNTAVWCVFMNVTLPAAVHLGRYYVENLPFTKNQLFNSAKQLFQVTEKRIRKKSTWPMIDYKELTWRSTTLPWQSDWAYECQNLFSPSRCSVWEAWVTNQSKYLENRYLKRSEPNQWRADGVRVENIARIHHDWITVWNLSSLKSGSSSGECTKTLYRENEETQKFCYSFELYSQIFAGMAIFWDLDKSYGTELILINQMEIGIRLLNKWCSTLQKEVNLHFVPPTPWKEEN